MADKRVYKRRERMMSAVETVLPAAITIPKAGSECKARCIALEGAAKEDCENECDAWEATAIVAERLRRLLLLSFHEVIWNGGNIDPHPDPLALEKAVRLRFTKSELSGD